MTYRGRMKNGVVVLEGPDRPPEGAVVQVEEVPAQAAAPIGAALDALAGKAQGLPADLAQRHDHYRRMRP